MHISYGYCGIMTWEFEHSIVTNARKETIWALYSRVESWPLWDHGIEDISLDGAFREGTKGKIKPEGQGLLSYRITLTDPEKGFSDETIIEIDLLQENYTGKTFIGHQLIYIRQTISQ